MRNWIAAGCLVAVLGLSGCALLDGGEAEKAKIVAETKAEIDAKTREVEAEKQRVALELAKAQRDANRQIAELKNVTDTKVQEIADDLNDKGISKQAALDAFVANRQAKVEELNRSAADRIAAIERQNAAFTSLVDVLGPAAQGAASAVPGGGLILAAITGIAGAFGIGRSARPKARTSAGTNATPTRRPSTHITTRARRKISLANSSLPRLPRPLLPRLRRWRSDRTPSPSCRVP